MSVEGTKPAVVGPPPGATDIMNRLDGCLDLSRQIHNKVSEINNTPTMSDGQPIEAPEDFKGRAIGTLESIHEYLVSTLAKLEQFI